jgi:hypothetical protein
MKVRKNLKTQYHLLFFDGIMEQQISFLDIFSLFSGKQKNSSDLKRIVKIFLILSLGVPNFEHLMSKSSGIRLIE